MCVGILSVSVCVCVGGLVLTFYTFPFQVFQPLSSVSSSAPVPHIMPSYGEKIKRDESVSENMFYE